MQFQARMKILHITNDYSGSTVYKNLIAALDNLDVEQIVYTPIRSVSQENKNRIELKTVGSEIIYRPILNKSDRLFLRKKIYKIKNDIESLIDLNEVSFIHAHTWYSDGGVAFLLAKKYNIPYLVTVRNTDLNLFQKYMIHHRVFGRSIIEKSKAIILISASYKDRLLQENSLQKNRSKIEPKLAIIPNGVDPYWLQNSKRKDRNYAIGGIIQALYVGQFTRGKNIPLLQQAIKEINTPIKKIHLHLVGGKGKAEKKVLNFASKHSEFVTYHGFIYDFEKLKSFFQKADVFVMPSKAETFGLVYVEAMLQGLPILYTENEGIDGFYPENIGEKVKQGTVQEIREKLLLMIENYQDYKLSVERLKINHDWNLIAKKYLSIYMKNRR